MKSISTSDFTTAKKQRRRSGSGVLFLLLLVLIAAMLVFGAGFLMPARLSLAQEQVLGVLHGGIINREERTYIDGCVQAAGEGGAQAVSRTTRTIAFADGTVLTITFTSRPSPTNAQCTNQ